MGHGALGTEVNLLPNLKNISNESGELGQL